MFDKSRAEKKINLPIGKKEKFPIEKTVDILSLLGIAYYNTHTATVNPEKCQKCRREKISLIEKSCIFVHFSQTFASKSLQRG